MRISYSIPILSLYGTAFSAAISGAPSANNPDPVIKSQEDIPTLPEGYSWTIKERPYSDNLTTAAANTRRSEEAAADYVVTCTGHSGSGPPLSDDCNNAIAIIQSVGGSVGIPAGYCHEVVYGTCLIYACTACNDIIYPTSLWINIASSVRSLCVDFLGETGAAYDSGAHIEVGVEHSGDELPPYRCS